MLDLLCAVSGHALRDDCLDHWCLLVFAHLDGEPCPNPAHSSYIYRIILYPQSYRDDFRRDRRLVALWIWQFDMEATATFR
jgi:hypothetical protein